MEPYNSGLVGKCNWTIFTSFLRLRKETSSNDLFHFESACDECLLKVVSVSVSIDNSRGKSQVLV